MLIYVAGPYSAPTEPERVENVNAAIRVGLKLMQRGHVVVIPHLTHYTDAIARDEMGWEVPYEEWMRQDFALLDRCDALFLVGHSPGADRELERAAAGRKAIFVTMDRVPVVAVPSKAIRE